VGDEMVIGYKTGVVNDGEFLEDGTERYLRADVTYFDGGTVRQTSLISLISIAGLAS
jgi:hypothetical protein